LHGAAVNRATRAALLHLIVVGAPARRHIKRPSARSDVTRVEISASPDRSEPVKPAWDSATTLIVVPHGSLGQLPFSLLPTKPVTLEVKNGALFSRYRSVPWLARTHAVVVLPAAGSLATLRALPPGDPTRLPFIGFGDPFFSKDQARRAAASEIPAAGETGLSSHGMPITLRRTPIRGVDAAQLAMLPRLPETADEIRSIALAMHADLTRDVFVGVQANEKTVRSVDLSRYRVIAFATHGLVAGDLDGLSQPALALTAPDVANVEGDGLLTVDKILGLRLNADWVVLSACNTASGQGAGAEAISGLGRAFFYAGARSLLVSNWPVETTSAKILTTGLFRRQAANPRQGRAQALQDTINALIDSGTYVDPQTKQVVFSYAHPIFWAPFTLVGDGGSQGRQP
jgi:CHAT domain-containing protein